MSPRAQQMNMQPLQWMVDESIAFIREREPPEGYLLADSFGKDSTVLLELTKMAGVKYVHIHHRTGIDPPELTKFGMKHHSEARIIRPKMTIWEGIHQWFPPTLWERWCCKVLKEFQVKGDPRNILVGIRAEESSKRGNRPRICHIGKPTKKSLMIAMQIAREKANGQKEGLYILEAMLSQSQSISGYTHFKPIFSWLEWHVWEFIESMNLPYCELYDEGFNRLG